jgi:hypothetical protein
VRTSRGCAITEICIQHAEIDVAAAYHAHNLDKASSKRRAAQRCEMKLRQGDQNDGENTRIATDTAWDEEQNATFIFLASFWHCKRRSATTGMLANAALQATATLHAPAIMRVRGNKHNLEHHHTPHTSHLTPHTQHATRHLCAFMSPPERTGGLDDQLAPFAHNLRGGGHVSVCGPNRRSAAAPPSPLCKSLGRARLRPRGCR